MKYIIIFAVLLSCIACCGTRHIKEVPVQTITKDSIYYNVVHKDTTVYHVINADTVKSSQNLNIDDLGPVLDTLSVLSNNYATSIVELAKRDENSLYFSHVLLQKSLKIDVPVKFVYLDKYVTKYELKEVPIEVIVKEPIRDRLFWLSIIGNIITIFLIIIWLKLK